MILMQSICDAAIGGELGQGRGQTWQGAAAGITGVEGIANGAQQLGAGEGGYIHRINRVQAALVGHHQLTLWLGRQASDQRQHQGRKPKTDGVARCGADGVRPGQATQVRRLYSSPLELAGRMGVAGGGHLLQ